MTEEILNIFSRTNWSKNTQGNKKNLSRSEMFLKRILYWKKMRP